MPVRFLRPKIRTSPRWNAVSHAAARLYVALLTLVDDFGRYDGRPAVLHGDAFAVWNDQHLDTTISIPDVAGYCEELKNAGLAIFYTVDDRTYLMLTQWKENKRAKASKWPEPLGSANGCVQMLVNVGDAQTSVVQPKNGDSTEIPASQELAHLRTNVSDAKTSAADPRPVSGALAGGVRRTAYGGTMGEKFAAAWERWLKHGKELVYGPTDSALEAQWHECRAMGEAAACEAIEWSIRNNRTVIEQPGGNSRNGRRGVVPDHSKGF